MIKPIDFPYCTNLVTKEAFDVHIKGYHAYVDKVNEIQGLLDKDPQYAQSNSVYSYYRGLEKGLTYALNAVNLHESYFENISQPMSAQLAQKDTMPGKTQPVWQHSGPIGPRTQKLFDTFFGSYDGWKTSFTAACLSARGWATLTYDGRIKYFINYLSDSDDDGILVNAYPIVICDMYEHAYYINYQSDKAKYVSKFFDNINWDVVEKRVNMYSWVKF